jgi:curved DNA-binding protein CbpA
MTSEFQPHTPPAAATPPPRLSPGEDPFDALGLAPAFGLSSAEIERAYLARAGALHPDRSTGDAAAAARLNLARQVIKDPMTRAEALLALRSGPAPAADKSLPPGFLGEILDVRERLEAALASGSDQERSRWEDWASERRRGHIAAITRLFDAGDGASLRGVRLELNVWRYTERVLEQLAGPAAPTSTTSTSTPPTPPTTPGGPDR